MKTQSIKILISMLVLSLHNILSAQSLFVDGHFLNSKEKKVVADYILMCDNEIIMVGRNKRIKVELSLNKFYTLILFKEGFEVKSIGFSTRTQEKDDFIFAFDVILNELIIQNNEVSKPEYSNVIVYYDPAIKNFSYDCVSKNKTNY